MITFSSGVINTQDITNKIKKQERRDSLKSYFQSSAIGGAIGAFSIGVAPILKKFGNLPQDKIDIMHNAAEKALEVTGLSKKGVEIKYFAPSSKKGFLRSMFSNPLEQIAQGYNAAFVPEEKVFKEVIGNKILMPAKDLSYSAFHEIGHAVNFNNSRFWKSVQRIQKPFVALATLPMLYGAFSKKSEPKDGKELTKWQKVNNFVRDNAGKISLGLMLPNLAEEAMASIRGQRLANKLLEPSMAKHVLKGNLLAYSTYIAGAAALALGSYAAVKIKDNLVEKHKQK